MGGGGVISSGVFSQLDERTTGPVTRIAGVDRYETAAMLSQFSFPDGLGDTPTVFVASGETFADALSAAAAAALPPSVPLLLTPRDVMPNTVRAEIARLAPEFVYVLGGTAAVSEAVVADLATQVPFVERIAGSDRYSTSALIVESFFAESEEVIVATGTNFPDGLVAGALGQPLVLVPPGTIPPSTIDAIANRNAQRLMVLGGTGAISDAQALDLDELVGG